jgi:tetratricopeptide (TPR) repeat protein
VPNHPDDQLLLLYSFDPTAVADAAALETHVETCPDCRKALDEHRAFDALLADAHSFPDEETDASPPPSLRQLSAMAARNREEDADAAEKLDELLEPFVSGASDAFIWADIAADRAYYTGGVVRKLADAADKASYNAPRRALILAETAAAIVGMLSTSTYSSMEIAALRGLAWKQRANANRHLGRFSAALEALDRAERAYRELPRPELDLASLMYIRASIYCDQQAYELAEPRAEQSASAFAQLGQTELYFRSRFLQGIIAFEKRELGDAQSIFDSVFAYGEASENLSWVARASQALGNCHLERRDRSNASQFLHRGLVAFRDLGILSEEIRCRWGLALVVQQGGQHRVALERLRTVRDEFVMLGDVSDAALVTLDIMETFLAIGKPRDVRVAAGNIVKMFKDAGMVTGALTAADYLKHAAAMESVTPTLIEHIRRYFRRVELEPDLAFVTPRL